MCMLLHMWTTEFPTSQVVLGFGNDVDLVLLLLRNSSSNFMIHIRAAFAVS